MSSPFETLSNIEPIAQPLYQPGDRVGTRYEIKKMIYRGSNSYIYLAYRYDYQEHVVLKTLSDEKQKERLSCRDFEYEVNRWIDLDWHPNILDARWAEYESNRCFLELEYIEPDEYGRTTLADHLRFSTQKPISAEQALMWAIECCRAMEHLRSKGYCAHQDLKPENLLIDKNKTLRLTDFEFLISEDQKREAPLSSYFDWSDFLSKHIPLRSAVLPHPITIIGTFGYIAPEILEGYPAGVQSDIFSLGVILWQMLTGNADLPTDLPPGSRCLSLPDWLKKYRQRYSCFWQKILENGSTSDELFEPVTKCLSLNPHRRYKDFSELRIHLERLYEARVGYPPAKSQPKQRNALDYNKRGVCLNFRGMQDKAYESFRKAISLDSDCVSAWSNLAELYLAKGDRNMAFECYEKVFSIQPNHANTLCNKGLFLLEQRYYQDALACFDAAIAADPTFYRAYALKGEILYKTTKFEDALSCLQQAVFLNPRDIAAIRLRILILYAQQKYALALDECDHALLFSPHHQPTWKLKKDCLRAMNQKKVLTVLEHLNCLKPAERKSEMTRYFSLGQYYWEKKEYDNSLEAFNCVLCFDIRHLKTWVCKYHILKNLKNEQQATNAANKALWLNRNITL